MTLVWILLLAFLGVFAFVRLAPSDPNVWHVDPSSSVDKTFRNGVIRRISTGTGGLRRMDSVITSDPRSAVLAGAVDEGKVTYISRTRMMGFPDYTTVIQDGEDLVIYARSRFGRKDFDVNRKRVERWIAALTAY
ncbi:DUF1499 domain-containing protein [uncultured Shimia sp.]|uniref:DUF1499 domain-containing protein n=1 Tax=uncultured Shimia sp. TaxID=573152 RepID=UPI0034186DA1